MKKSLWFILRTLLFGWVLALIQLFILLARRCRNLKQPQEKPRCLPLKRPEVITPDPLIYPQYFLQALGIPITWDSPDIQLWKDGSLVSSSLLDESTTYDVVARIWNASPDAPTIGMTVHFSFLEFGIGTTAHPIGSKSNVSVGVKGGMTCPSYVSIPWTTPAGAGHYCLQVLLAPIDDSNYSNNLSQENTNVGIAHSPALFTFALRNNTAESRAYRFEADAYTITAPDPCSIAARETLDARRLDRFRQSTSLPPGWSVEFEPDSPTLGPDQQVTITAKVTPASGFAGTQVVNVNAFYQETLAGGVTLIVKV